MRILEYGFVEPKEIECHECKATLEYTEPDTKIKLIDGDLYKIITCPVCGDTIKLELIA